MGPNARKRPRPGSAVPTGMIRSPDNKVSSQHRPSGPSERWIIKIESRYGGQAVYWGNREHGTGLTPFRTNAITYGSEDTARYEGYKLKELKRIGDFEVVQIPPKPERRSYGHGTGGRA